MNERLVTTGGVLIALLLVAGLFVQTPPELPVSLPTSHETRPNGYEGLRLWLTGSGVEVASSRGRFTALPEISSQGSILLVTAPFQRQPRADEISALKDWVASGNTLLVLAALNDTPDWATTADSSNFVEDMERLTGSVFSTASDASGEPLLVGEDGPTDVLLGPTSDEHPLASGVDELLARSDLPASIWQPDASTPLPGEPFLVEQSSGLAAAWSGARGRGHLIVLAVGSPFTNRALGAADNGQLIRNLVRWHLGHGGKVIFDDLHQGLSDLYDPEAFYSDSRVGFSVLFVLAFWFVYMIGTQNRLAPVRTPSDTPRQGDFVRSMGGFFARKLTNSSTALMMFDTWFQELENRGLTTNTVSPWAFLEQSPLIDPQEGTELMHIHQRANNGTRVNLIKLHNRLQHIREVLG